MKIALFSDIHANLPALEAFFLDVDTRGVDQVYCLGDLVGYNIWPNEVISKIRKRKVPTIAGNYDFGIGRKSDDCGCAYKTDREKASGAVSISYTNKIVEEKKEVTYEPCQLILKSNFNSIRISSIYYWYMGVPGGSMSICLKTGMKRACTA